MERQRAQVLTQITGGKEGEQETSDPCLLGKAHLPEAAAT